MYQIRKDDGGTYSVVAVHEFGEEEFESEIETFAEACALVRDGVIATAKYELDEIAERYDDIPDD